MGRQHYVYGIVSSIPAVCDGPCLVQIPVYRGVPTLSYVTVIAKSATSKLYHAALGDGLYTIPWACDKPLKTFKTKAAAMEEFLVYLL